jgi:hypothetical protein
VLDAFDLALRFVVAHAGPYGRVAAVAVLPAALVSWGLARTVGWAWGWGATILLAFLVQTPFTVLASRLVFEPDARLRDILGASLRALPRVVVLRVLLVLGVQLGMLLFIVPGVWISIGLLFAVEVAVLEGATVRVAISRTTRLTGAHFGRAFIASFVLSTLYVWAPILGDVVGRTVVSDLFQFREPEALWSAGGSSLALLGFWLFLPYAATARFFVYLDLRTRSEGWDIQTRFAAIALRARDAERRAA